jgi:hypothetical protein
MKRIFYFTIFFVIVLSACNPAVSIEVTEGISTSTPPFTPTPTRTLTATPTSQPTPSVTRTATITTTPTETLTPSITPTPTITLTPTYDFPDVAVKMQAHCRYGPAVAYLHAADLYPGDKGTVRGRTESGTWLYIKFDKLKYFCWAAASVLDIVEGNIFLVYPTERKLPHSDFYAPPENVQAARQGDQVNVTWKEVKMTVDDYRGYLIEATICKEGTNTFVVVATENTFYTFTDEPGCRSASRGLLYTVDKHGYSDPVEIPWPAP